jgi:small ligand-binding sensory domain FIST
MKWASTVSEQSRLGDAIHEAADGVRAQMGSVGTDLALLFVSPHHQEEFDGILELVQGELGSPLVLGCSAGGVIGGGREVEQSPGVSLTVASLPGIDLTAFHVAADALPDRRDVPAWERLLGVSSAREPHFLFLPDPFSFDSETFLRGVDHVYPASRKIGGLASGGQAPGANALFLGRDVHRGGLVGLALSGNVQVDTIVAQGCRPIGSPMFVTQCHRNLIVELDGEPALRVLQRLYEDLDPADQGLARQSLFLGVVMSENRQEYHQGDFLIRNLLGLDASRKALAVGAVLRENSVVQFHLRDAKTSARDLEQMLARHRGDGRAEQSQGALLFSCLGRGAYLYGEPDHDSSVFRRHLGGVPLGGFFCNGEIGPVHGTTFLHGYTSAFGLFRHREP